ncbi:uncharacterized protein AMSG_01080 [Thecamonas trahens ATCC 50062]|uniref:Uncharacterized protein n=1 Tax=Thecamonas trahens ATCC 50062 TaxID=461836 RepID=A0A0L0DJI2_THETB|nr:hypothetical protein AMSG_01080 [Thecamonas trahens ATCC 50062]KNC52251.1 hypothetical protein AMSG_01080 [Thecamonas trahens ATCC 50062]|eukprot:XP_013762253.1 hypothetical protein AMSG_01080 [Thecamonas trahens ATCC 50062]
MSSSSRPPSGTLNELMLQAERAILWSAVGEEWREIRAPWVDACSSASSPQALAELLVALGRSMRPSVMHSRWPRMLPKWESKLGLASSYSDVSRMLLALEMNIDWNQATKSSRFRSGSSRDEWRSRVRSASSSTGASGSKPFSFGTLSAKPPRTFDDSSRFLAHGDMKTGYLPPSAPVSKKKLRKQSAGERKPLSFGHPASGEQALAVPQLSRSGGSSSAATDRTSASRSPLLALRRTQSTFCNSAARRTFVQALVLSSLVDPT